MASGRVGSNSRWPRKSHRSRPPMGVKDVPPLVKEGHDPIHSVYVHVQNITRCSPRRVGAARVLAILQDRGEGGGRIPARSGCSMSHLTRNDFTTWAFFDVRLGLDKETMVTCLIDLA